jgi:hypothetical protein
MALERMLQWTGCDLHTSTGGRRGTSGHAISATICDGKGGTKYTRSNALRFSPPFIRMTQSEVQLLALLCLAAAIIAAGLAPLGYLRTAATVNGALSLLFVSLEAPSLIAWGLSPDSYVQQYGRAALNELNFNFVGLALSLVALVASGLALWWKPVLFSVGWLANVPTVTMLLYFAFWFHIF